MSVPESSPVAKIVDTVSSWPGISTGEGRFGSTAFKMAGREIGHVHRGGAVDVGYPTPIRDRLIAEGLTGEHHVIPDSNATTFHVESMDDVDGALTLLRISYLYHVGERLPAPEGGEVIEDVDVAAELAELNLSEELRAVIDRTTGTE